MRNDIVKTILLIIILTAAMAFLRFSSVGEYLRPSNVHLLQDKLEGFHSLAPAVFFILGAALTGIGAPRTVISVLGGMIFGFAEGLFLSTIAAITGATIIFTITRHLGRPLFKRKIGHYLKTVEKHVEDNAFLVVVAVKQLPVPGLVVNMLFALTSIRFASFLAGSAVGLVPEAAIFSLFGSSLRGSFALKVSLASFSLILLIIAVRVYLKRSKLARELSDDLAVEKE